MLNVDDKNRKIFRVSCKGERGDGFSNGHVIERHLDLSQSGALGEYGNIWEICAHMFELDDGWFVGYR